MLGGEGAGLGAEDEDGLEGAMGEDGPPEVEDGRGEPEAVGLGEARALEGAATWSVSGTTAELRTAEDSIAVTLSNITPTPFGG